MFNTKLIKQFNLSKKLVLILNNFEYLFKVTDIPNIFNYSQYIIRENIHNWLFPLILKFFISLKLMSLFKKVLAFIFRNLTILYGVSRADMIAS